MTFQPVGSKIVVEPERGPDATPGGILLPDRAKQPPVIGRIVAIGPEYGGPGKIGDRVLFEQYTGAEYKDGDKTYRILRRKFVLSVVS